MAKAALTVLLAAALLAAGCGASARRTHSTPSAPTQPPSHGKGAGAGILARPSRYGTMLFDQRRRALYLFTRDGPSTSRCYGRCAAEWPPFIVAQTPTARVPARAALLGTTRRKDGTLQATYRDHPLYYYVGDKPRQVLCQDVDLYGGRWYVVAPAGSAIR